ncbi:hypothetical protein A1D22_09330 [Pasteurellaceae bacterium LFhippo2]|nr:hypothetical protein [Pasteurellaceae bacterium LFhippo2]
MQMHFSDKWDYEARSAQVDAARASAYAEKVAFATQALAQQAVKPTCPDVQATEKQLELFELVSRSSYDFVERLLRKLPRKRQQDHFRSLYMREYRSIKDDGSISFDIGQKQEFLANNYLRDLIENRLGRVFAQYKFNLSWLNLNISQRWEWAQEEVRAQAKQAPTSATDVKAPVQQYSILDELKKGRKPSALEQKANLPFYLITEKKLKRQSQQLSDIFGSLQRDFFTEQANSGQIFTESDIDQVVETVYRKCGLLCQGIGFDVPYWATFINTDKPNIKSMEIALNKIADEVYWFRTLRKAQKQMIEHIAIACGEVRKDVAPYISNNGFGDWQTQMKKNYAFLKAMIIENVKAPEEQVELLDMFLRSSSNPQLRRLEMMTRLRGIEEWAEENDYQALFLTLTAPSSYHAQHSKGGQNRKWSGASPKQTQAYLNKIWAQGRAILKKRGIEFFGMRVAEPHHDGTPHWHLLMYVKPDHANDTIEILRNKALEVDGDEKGAQEHRFKAEFCDKEKGSATAYIAKYISKNIDGFAEDGAKSDEVDGLDFKDNAKRVRAWASLWNIRQFQFYGASSISVWRELRRLTAGQCADEAVEELRIGADLGDFAFYLDKQGGAGAPRKNAVAKAYYEDKGQNKYGEDTKRIIGVINQLKATAEVIRTRLKEWVIKLKPKANQAEHSEAKNTGLCPAWTCVSNCNPSGNQAVTNTSKVNVDDYLNLHADKVHHLTQAMIWRGIKPEQFDKLHIFSLIQGGSVQLLGRDYITFNGYEVVISNRRKDINMDSLSDTRESRFISKAKRYLSEMPHKDRENINIEQAGLDILAYFLDKDKKSGESIIGNESKFKRIRAMIYLILDEMGKE